MKNQSGAALIVVLSMLTASLMLGLTSMQSSQIDERLAGNYKAASQAQMGAEEAASIGWENVPAPNKFSETSLGDIENISWNAFLKDDNFEGENESAGSCEYADCYYRYVDFSGRYYIVAMGGVNNGDVSVSEPVIVNVKFDSGFKSLSPLTIPQKFANFSASSGGARPKGMGLVPDVLVSSSEDVSEVRNAYNDIDGFDVSRSFEDAILSDSSDADPFSDFIAELKSQSDRAGNTYYRGLTKGPDNNTAFGSLGSPKVSFVNGSVSANGISGAGVLVVNGDFESNGNPSFDGLVIVLGDYLPGNGGGGEDINGALLVAPYESKGNAEQKNTECESGCKFSQARVEFGTGGGGFDLVHDPSKLDTAFSLLSEEAKSFWDPQGGENGGASGEPTIESWQ